MADIRQSTAIKDNFNRADENPIAYSATYPWRVVGYHGLGDDNVVIDTNVLNGGGNSSAWAYWDADIQSDNGGATPEVWARLAQSSYTFPYGTRMALMTSNAYGYANLETGGFDRILRRYTGGGAFTDISGSIDGGSLDPTTFTSSFCLQLLRLTATHFEVWRTTDQNDDTAWTLSASVPDTNYRDNMFMWLGATGNEDGWTEFGGGGRRNHPQIYRWIKN